jgi:hypothetical protein
MRNFIKISLPIVAVVFLAAACGEDDGDAASILDLKVVGVQADKAMPGRPTDPISGAQTIRFTVSGPGMSDVSTLHSFLNSDAGELPAFPEGYERQVTVELCRTDCAQADPAEIVSRGRSVPQTVGKNDRTKRLNVFVAPRNSLIQPVKLQEGALANTPEPSTMAQTRRVGATVTQLDDGRILIAGGAKVKTGARTWYFADDLEEVYGDVEIYNPRTGEFTATVVKMNKARAFHQAVLLGGTNRGRVAILGGYENIGGVLKPSRAVEIYDPSTGGFSLLAEDKGLPAGRALFTASAAYPDDGVIFIAGGLTDPGPAGGYWELYLLGQGPVDYGPLYGGPDATSPGVIRYNHSTTYVPTYGFTEPGTGSEAYLIAGGQNPSSVVNLVEAYEIVRNGERAFMMRRDDTSVTTLPGGGRTMMASAFVPSQGIVYLFGGFTGLDLAGPSDRADVFWFGRRGFIDGQLLYMNQARGALTATALDRTTVLLAGGWGTNGPVVDTEVLFEDVICEPDPEKEGEQKCNRRPNILPGRTPTLEASRSGHLAILDATRRVLFLGGVSDSNLIPAPILYNPD